MRYARVFPIIRAAATLAGFRPAFLQFSGILALFAGSPVAGLMMTGRADDDRKKTLFLLPKFWPSLPPLVPVPSSGIPFLDPGSSGKMALSLLPILWGRFTQS